MRNVFFGIFITLCICCNAYSSNENVPTSKSYVDSKLSTKLDKLPGLGSDKMLMYTTTSDTGHQVGTPRDIVNTLGDQANGVYTDTTGTSVPTRGAIKAGLDTKQDNIFGSPDYVVVYTNTSGQLAEKGVYNGTTVKTTDSLVTAKVTNDAIVNAVNSELTPVPGIGWRLNDTPTLMTTRSKNLFDISRVQGDGWHIVNNSDGSLTARGESTNSAQNTGKKLSELAPDLIVGKTYTFSFESEGGNYFTLIYNLSTGDYYHWRSGTSLVMTQHWLDSKVYFQAPTNEIPIKIWNVQIEEGPVATPYEPYGDNTYSSLGN